MKILLKNFCFILFILVFLPSIALAQEYIVKPAILIPENFRSQYPENSEILNTYKESFLTGISEAQKFYSRELNGKTFEFDRNIKIAYSTENLENIDSLSVIYTLLRGEVFVPDPKDDQSKTIYLIAIIGTATQNPIQFKNTTFISQQNLDLLGLESSNWYHDAVVQNIVHELGHAFGLTNTGWAQGHTCSQARPNVDCYQVKMISCSNSPTGECATFPPYPLPTKEEAEKDIMFYRVTPDLFLKDMYFSNTVHNPLIQKLYLSPFMKPVGGTPPPITNAYILDQPQNPFMVENAPSEEFITIVSNYPDFRQFNDPNDQGSPTTSFIRGATTGFTNWNLSTTTDQTIYYMEITPTETTTHQTHLEPGETAYLKNVAITAVSTKTQYEERPKLLPEFNDFSEISSNSEDNIAPACEAKTWNDQESGGEAYCNEGKLCYNAWESNESCEINQLESVCEDNDSCASLNIPEDSSEQPIPESETEVESTVESE